MEKCPGQEKPGSKASRQEGPKASSVVPGVNSGLPAAWDVGVKVAVGLV